jgi:predicted ribosomally synthesized peptide with nif11-like leader
MSIENVTQFAQRAAQEPALREKIQTLLATSDSDPAASIVRLAEEEGLPFTAEEFGQFRESPQAGELSDEQLANVAGGGDFENFFASVISAFALSKCEPPPPEQSGPYANYTPNRRR